jgi:hypothetical protein
MNRCLLRQLKPFLLYVTPRNARKLIRAFGMVETVGGKNEEKLKEGLKAFIEHTRRTLKKQGVPESQVCNEIAKIGIIAVAWLQKWMALWSTFLSPAILLLFCLATTLDSNLVPERQDFTFEEIKQSLWDRHWPPQRQRCDFIAASAY